MEAIVPEDWHFPDVNFTLSNITQCFQDFANITDFAYNIQKDNPLDNGLVFGGVVVSSLVFLLLLYYHWRNVTYWESEALKKNFFF
jgi:hypothetical protein